MGGALDETIVLRLLQHVNGSADGPALPLAELAEALADSIVLLCNQIAATVLSAPFACASTTRPKTRVC